MQQISEFICDGKVEREFGWKLFLKWFYKMILSALYIYMYVENEIFILNKYLEIFTTLYILLKEI